MLTCTTQTIQILMNAFDFMAMNGKKIEDYTQYIYNISIVLGILYLYFLTSK